MHKKLAITILAVLAKAIRLHQKNETSKLIVKQSRHTCKTGGLAPVPLGVLPPLLAAPPVS